MGVLGKVQRCKAVSLRFSGQLVGPIPSPVSVACKPISIKLLLVESAQSGV